MKNYTFIAIRIW